MTSLSDGGMGRAAENEHARTGEVDHFLSPRAPRQWLEPYEAARYARLIREKNPEWVVWTCAGNKEHWAVYVQMSRERVTEGVWVFTARQAEELLT